MLSCDNWRVSDGCYHTVFFGKISFYEITAQLDFPALKSKYRCTRTTIHFWVCKCWVIGWSLTQDCQLNNDLATPCQSSHKTYKYTSALWPVLPNSMQCLVHYLCEMTVQRPRVPKTPSSYFPHKSDIFTLWKTVE